jgi:diguanylate cyclase (GGDEF)-like protein
MNMSGRAFVVVASLAPLVAIYPFLPTGLIRDVAYPAIGLVCASVGVVGVFRRLSGRRTAWVLVVGGFLGWVIGDVVFLLEQRVFDSTAYPAPSDAVYVASYGLIAAGLLMFVRLRGERGNRAAMLDATILAMGVAVVVGVFVLAPIADDSSLSAWAKLTSSVYPIADVLLLGILVRLWTTPGARTASFRLLVGALTMTLLADAIYNVSVITSESNASLVISDMCWLSGYALVACAVWSASANELTERPAGREDLVDPGKRLFVLTGGLLLPAATLLADGLTTQDVQWEISGVFSALLSVLVLVRMAGLLAVVRAQAVQLAALARADGLTGIPNRRTWDFELSRACRTARQTGEPLSIALLDLDHFKDYNDTHGHQAGDRLLREATSAWTEQLGEGEVLARYGGEEFAMLFSGRPVMQAQERVRLLLGHTPPGVTCSAGVAQWDPATEPSAGVAAADQALYAAKRGGRNQVCSAPSPSEDRPGTTVLANP